MALRWKSKTRVAVDDYLLIFACITLTGATAVMQWGTEATYEAVSLSTDPLHPGLTENLNDMLVKFQRTLFSYLTLTYATIFAAKFSYLYFFRRLIDRLKPLIIYWRVVCGFTATVCIVCIIQSIVECPYVDSRACKLPL
jgi:hypothetical protein